MIRKKNILFRCDGSTKIGMGHVVRCLALADELRDNYDCTITFAMRQSELGIQKVRGSYPVFNVDQNDFDYELWLINCIQETKANIMIMDMRDNLSRISLRKIKQDTGIKVITIDDPEDKRLEADIAFYPPVPQVMKMNWDYYQGKIFTGWEYVILRKEFLQTFQKPENPIPNIFVSMGATDPKNMTMFVVETFDQLDFPFHCIIMIGPGYPFKETLIKRLSKANFKHQLLVDPQNIADRMAGADFAIISFGQTAYELAALGIPSIYICLTEDHCQSATIFEKEEMGISAGMFGGITIINLKKIIESYRPKKNNFSQKTKLKSVLFSASKISSNILA